MSDKSLDLMPEDFFSGRAIPPETLRDLIAIAKLDVRSVGRISEHLTNLHGFSAKESIEGGVRACLTDQSEEVAESVVRTLLNIEQGDVDRIVSTVDRWRKSNGERAVIFNEELFSGLDRNLKTLIAKYASVELLRKANRLLREVGNEFKDISFFCDMRPVFDESREHVEGFVTLANMRLIYISQDGVRHACEVALTEDELHEMMEVCGRARAKLEVLKATSVQLSRRVKE